MKTKNDWSARCGGTQLYCLLPRRLEQQWMKHFHSTFPSVKFIRLVSLRPLLHPLANHCELLIAWKSERLMTKTVENELFKVAKHRIKEQTCRHIALPGFQSHYKVAVGRTAYYWCKNKYGQWNGMQNKAMYLLANIFLTKMSRTHNWERVVFSINDAMKTGSQQAERMKWDRYLTPQTRSSLKLIEDLNSRHSC